MMHRDSVSNAELRRMAFSRIRERTISSMFCLQVQLATQLEQLVNTPYRPISNSGDAIGENSVLIVKMPSNLRSG
jgi:hypothetical protein